MRRRSPQPASPDASSPAASSPDTLLSPELEAAFRRDGYVVVSLLDDYGVEALRRAFEDLGRAPGDAYLACHSSRHSYDASYRRAAAGIVRAHIAPHLDEHVQGQRPVGGEFFVRWPGFMGGAGLHRDAVLVDEDVSRSATVWLAIDRAEYDTVPFWFVPGSHRWWPQGVVGDLRDVGERIAAQHSAPVLLDPGQAVICDRALLWFTPPKTTDRPALWATLALVADGAPLIRSVARPGDGIELFEDDEASILGRSAFLPELVGGKPLRTLPAAAPLTVEALDALVAEGRAVRTDTPCAATLNAHAQWCHRCGEVDRSAPPPDPWVGTVEHLCDRCRADEPALIAHADARGEYADLDVEAWVGRRPAPRERDEWARCTHTSEQAITHLGADADARVLVDPVLDDRLRRDGYVVFPEPLIDRDAAAGLRGEFARLRGLAGDGFHNDFNDRDRVYRRNADAAIAAALDPVMQGVFNGYRAFIRPFLCKFPGEGSYFEPHRDWMYVDEHRGVSSFVFFVALEDIDLENGQVCVLPRSHRFDDMLRGTDLWSPWVAHEAVLRDRFETFSLKAGQVAVWNHAAVHGSYPNVTSDPRIAAGMWVCPEDAQLVHFRRIDGSTAARYEVDPEFFRRENPYAMQAAPPRLPVTEILPVGGRDLDADELAEALDRELLAQA